MTIQTRESMRAALVSTIESFRPEALTLEVENIIDDLLGAIDDQDEEDTNNLTEYKERFNDKFRLDLSPDFYELSSTK